MNVSSTWNELVDRQCALGHGYVTWWQRWESMFLIFSLGHWTSRTVHLSAAGSVGAGAFATSVEGDVRDILLF